MKKVLLLGLLSGMIWGGVLENTYSKKEFDKIDNRSGEEIVKQWAEDENKKMPKQQDQFTKLIKTTSIGNKIYYEKEINPKNNEKLKELLSTEKNKEKLMNDLYKESREILCKNQKDRAYFDKKNIGFQNDYYMSKNKEYIGGFSIDKSDCIKLEQEEKSKGKYSLY